MRKLVRAVAVVGCLVLAGSVAHAEESPLDAKLRHAVLSAIKSRNARAFTKQLNKLPLRLYHVWFDSPACAKEFGGKVSVEEARVPALVGCLSRLGLAEGAEGSLVHAPGVAVVPLIFRGKLAGLSGVAVDPTTPTVTDAALTANLAAGTLEVPPDAVTRAALDGANDRASVWLEACVDARGKIEKVSAKRASSDRAGAYAKTIQAAAARWTFRPFKRAGKPIRVCLQRPYAYPPES